MNFLKNSLEETWDELKEYHRLGILSEDMEKEMFGYMDQLQAEINRRKDANITDPEGWCDKDAHEYWDCECAKCSAEIPWQELEDMLVKGMSHHEAYQYAKTNYLCRKIDRFFMEDEYSPSNEVDLEFYLMERIWNKIRFRCEVSGRSKQEMEDWVDKLYERILISPHTHGALHFRINEHFEEDEDICAYNRKLDSEMERMSCM